MLGRPKTPEEYVDLVDQALFEIEDLRLSAEYDMDSMGGATEFLEQLERDRLLLVPDRCQVVGPVPLVEQVEIGEQLSSCRILERYSELRSALYEFVDSLRHPLIRLPAHPCQMKMRTVRCLSMARSLADRVVSASCVRQVPLQQELLTRICVSGG